MRVHYFAKELARCGHQIILLTRSLEGNNERLSVAALEADILGHDWSRPYHLPCVPVRCWSLDNIRDPAYPRVLRKLFIAWHYGLGDGVFSDWIAGSKPYWETLTRVFDPDVTWATFGNVDSWAIAQGLARQASIPWVADVKDGWESFIPTGFRRYLARRYRNAAAMTTNSRFIAEEAVRFFPRQKPQVIYSGADECWYGSKHESHEFRILLIGSVYNKDNLSNLIEGIRNWLLNRPTQDRDTVVVSYAGGDYQLVDSAFARLDGVCRTQLHGYLPQTDLARLCGEAAVNAYLWHPLGFHHKIIELLCVGRPIISYPGEYDEARDLARQVGGSLHVCVDSTELSSALDCIWLGDVNNEMDLLRLQEMSWAAQAEKLVDVFQQVLAR